MSLLIYETKNFEVFAAERPHISREDGGYIVIIPKNKKLKSRLDLSAEEASEAMVLTRLVGRAMIDGLQERGIKIKIINFQENGNWAYLEGREPIFHIHLYGRAEDSKRQPFGEALYLPDPSDNYYKGLEPLNDADIAKIRSRLDLLVKGGF